MRFLIGLLALGLHWAAFASMPTWRGAEIRQFGQSAAQPDLVYAVSRSDLFRSDDRGRTWRALRMAEPIDYAELYVDSKDPLHVLVLSRRPIDNEKPGLQESFDGGARWVQRAPLKYLEANGSMGGDFFPTGFAVPAEGKGADWWAYDGRWFRSPDSGQTWYRQTADEGRAFGAVQAKSFSYSLQDNVLWRSGGAGQPWVKVHVFEDAAAPGRRPGAVSNLMAIGDDELVLRTGRGNWLQSNDHGATWMPASNGFENLDQHRASSAVPQPRSPSEGETRCRVQRSTAAAGVLVALCVWNNGSAPAIACFHASTDAGRSWTPPRTRAGTSSTDCQAPGLPRGWSATAVMLDAADPKRMLAAWQAGGLYRSGDAGQSWQPSDEGLLFRNARASMIDWAAIGEPVLIKAVLYRDRESFARALASGVNINAAGTHLGGVLEADLYARQKELGEVDVPTPMMWSELRQAGATSMSLSLQGGGLMVRAVTLKLHDIANDLIHMGYDWGNTGIRATKVNAPPSEFDQLLRMSKGNNSSPTQVEEWIERYIKAARFPSADQTTMDLLNNGYPALAVKVLRASTRRTAFDLQSTPALASVQAIEDALLAAGKKSWAKRVGASTR